MWMKHPLFLTLTLVTFVAVSPSLAQKAIIKGQVIDIESNKPVSNASIVNADAIKLLAVSDSNGYFEFEDPDTINFFAALVALKMTKVDRRPDGSFILGMSRQYHRIDPIYLKSYPRDISKIPSAKAIRAASKLVTQEINFTYPPEGMAAFETFVGNELATSGVDTGADPIEVMFTINETGKATEINFSDSTAALVSSVRKILTDMQPWIVGTVRGLPVAHYYRLTIDPHGGFDELTLEFHKYFVRKLSYPLTARRRGTDGVVAIEFEMDSSGTPVNIVWVTAHEEIFSDKVLELVSNIDPFILQSINRFTGEQRFQFIVQFSLTSHSDAFNIPENPNAYRLPVIIIKPDELKTQSLPGEFFEALKEAKYSRALTANKMGATLFPAEILELKQLEQLVLEENYISQLPEDITRLRNLKTLYFWENNIASLPEGFSLLKKLTGVSLAANNFSAFPPQLTKMPNLKFVDVSDNDISSIPPEISNMKSLETLVIRGNPIPREDVTSLRLRLKTVKVVFDDSPKD